MADVYTGAYNFSSVVEGHHFYKTVWTSFTDEALQVY